TEWGMPHWVFGQSSFAVTPAGIVAVGRRDGVDHLSWLPALGAGRWGPPVALDVPFTSVDGLTAGPNGVAGFLGASFTHEPEVVTIDTAAPGFATGPVEVRVHRPARALGFGP